MANTSKLSNETTSKEFLSLMMLKSNFKRKKLWIGEQGMEKSNILSNGLIHQYQKKAYEK
ncbi:hypothetical protein BpHYR1_000785 [Brachionus plicatilis]|uniref:Uncharacterized protein n=1 Tax=Brachionus plicatilis TaxID=10195 RepID=A0A3M7QNJ2_BRAPC|nr:hypothetical protein BpHYR1_000785 [Brachionus plicatilis]